jgi:hypothetical protein
MIAAQLNICSPNHCKQMPKAPKEPKAKVEKEPKGRKGKKEKDPNAPKKPLGAYMFYCKEARVPLKEEHPELKVTEIGSKLGAQWKLLTEEEKKPYYDLAEKDKVRYAKEKGDAEE